MDANNELLQAIGQMMDSKLAAALEPIRADIQDLKTGQKDLQEQVERVRHSVVKIELEQLPRIAAALDGVVGGIEKEKEQDNRISVLEGKADNHSTRIWALEQVAKEA